MYHHGVPLAPEAGGRLMQEFQALIISTKVQVGHLHGNPSIGMIVTQAFEAFASHHQLYFLNWPQAKHDFQQRFLQATVTSLYDGHPPTHPSNVSYQPHLPSPHRTSPFIPDPGHGQALLPARHVPTTEPIPIRFQTHPHSLFYSNHGNQYFPSSATLHNQHAGDATFMVSRSEAPSVSRSEAPSVHDFAAASYIQDLFPSVSTIAEGPTTSNLPHQPPRTVFANVGTDDPSMVSNPLLLANYCQSPSSLSTKVSPKKKRGGTGFLTGLRTGLRYTEIVPNFGDYGPFPSPTAALEALKLKWRCSSEGILYRYGQRRGGSITAFCNCRHETSGRLTVKLQQSRELSHNSFLYEVKYDSRASTLLFQHIEQQGIPQPITEADIQLFLKDIVQRLIPNDSGFDGPVLSSLFSMLLLKLCVEDMQGCTTARLVLEGRGGFFKVATGVAKLRVLIEEVVRASGILDEGEEAVSPTALRSIPGSVHFLKIFSGIHSINRYLAAGTTAGISFIPSFPTLSGFLEFWKFKSMEELLTIQFLDEFLIGTNFTEATKDTAKEDSVYFTSPHQIWALYQLVLSDPDQKLQFTAVDAVFGMYRLGKKGSCVIALSSVFPDLPCESNSLVVRRHVPLPKALTASENGGTTHVLLKSTVWALEKLTGLKMSFAFVVKDMGKGLEKAVTEYQWSTIQANPTVVVTPITDIEHIRAGPLGIWKLKISNSANRREIGFDLALLHRTSTTVNFRNALEYFFRKWSSKGEQSFVDHFRSQFLKQVISPFFFCVCPCPGYTNNNQTGERYFRSLKGVTKLNETGVLDKNKGIVALATEGLPSILKFDSKKLGNLELGFFLQA